jgi:hypothetical protein
MAAITEPLIPVVLWCDGHTHAQRYNLLAETEWVISIHNKSKVFSGGLLVSNYVHDVEVAHDFPVSKPPPPPPPREFLPVYYYVISVIFSKIYLKRGNV